MCTCDSMNTILRVLYLAVMSFIPCEEDQQQWLSTVLLSRPDGSDTSNMEEITRLCQPSVSAAQKRQHVTYQEQAIEGRETGESSDSDSSQSDDLLSAVSPDYSSLDISDTPTSVLVLSGSTLASVLHHLGVVLQLVARGRLRHITSIWAEDWGLALAVLLRLHWTALTCEPVPKPHQLQDLLIRPMVALATASESCHSAVWQTHFEFYNKDGVPVLCDIFSRNYGPDVTAVLNTLPDGMEYADGIMAQVPFATTFRAFPERLTVRQLLTDLFEAQRDMRRGTQQSKMPHPHNSTHRTLWTAMMNDFGEHKGSDTQTLFIISYAGLARPPPTEACQYVPVDASNLTSYWDFQQLMQRVLEDDAFRDHSVDYALCTPYGAHDLAHGDMYRQTVNKLYHCIQHYKPVTQGSDVVDCVYWGSLVAAETDDNVCRSLRWSVPLPMDLFIPLPVKDTELRGSVTYATQQRESHYTSQPVLINTMPTKPRRPTHHTPCSWLKGVFRKPVTQ